MDIDDLGTCVPDALKSSSVRVSQKLDYPEKVWSQEIFDIVIRNSDSWIFLTNELIVLTQTQMTKIWKQYCCKRIFATNLDFAMKNEIWWLQRYIKLLAETRKRKNGPIFFSVDSNSSEFREHDIQKNWIFKSITSTLDNRPNRNIRKSKWSEATKNKI